MSFTLPDLPYAYDALAPHMSRETLEYHHDKHHKAYVDNGNKLLEGSRAGRQVARGGRQGLVRQERRPLQQCRPALQPHPFLEVDEAERRRRQDPRRAQGQDRQRSRRRRQDQGRLHPGRRHAVRLRLVLDRGEGRQARHHQDAERREPAGARRHADPRLRRVGALLLHRLPQPPAGLSQGVPRTTW